MNKNYSILLLISILLFLILFPLSNLITFIQNDEWVHYLIIKSFLSGDFSLHPIIGSSFYAQGFLGMAFSSLFGIDKLPVLTLLISMASYYIFILILNRLIKLSLLKTLFLSSLFLFNPFFVYGMWGFMTDNYFLFFFLLSLYFYLLFNEKWSLKYFVIFNVVSLLCFFVRQFSIGFMFGYALYFLFKKKFKFAIFQFSLVFLTLILYYIFFPMTLLMQEKSVDVSKLFDLGHTHKMVFSLLIYLSAFLLPLIFASLWSSFQNLKKKNFLILLFAFFFGLLLMYGLSPRVYLDGKPNLGLYEYKLSRLEFPYFENVFERKGFFPDGIPSGTKYHLKWDYSLFTLWSVIAGFGASFLLLLLVLNRKKLFNPFSFLIAAYVGMLLVSPSFYDRYLLPLIPLMILFLLSLKPKVEGVFINGLFVGFILFLFIISYNFSLDFIFLNKYVWDKSNDISSSLNIEKSSIYGSHCWNKYYKAENVIYKFSYDSPDLFEEAGYKLIEAKAIKYPLNLFRESKIYLYKKD